MSKFITALLVGTTMLFCVRLLTVDAGGYSCTEPIHPNEVVSCEY